MARLEVARGLEDSLAQRGRKRHHRVPCNHVPGAATHRSQSLPASLIPLCLRSGSSRRSANKCGTSKKACLCRKSLNFGLASTSSTTPPRSLATLTPTPTPIPTPATRCCVIKPSPLPHVGSPTAPFSLSSLCLLGRRSPLSAPSEPKNHCCNRIARTRTTKRLAS